MRKILILLTIVSLFVSCKENVVGDFNAETVKADLIKALGGSEWEANNVSNAYYAKIAFTGSLLTVTEKDGKSTNVGYQVTNVTAPEAERPNTIQLRLKSGLQLDEIYISNDYKELESVVYDKSINDSRGIAMFYTKIK